MNKVHFSSLKSNWRTPEGLYKELDKEFHFDLDPCPYREKDWQKACDWDGLKEDWGNCNFVNPPYARYIIDKWIEKGFKEWKKGKTVVFLIASRTDTQWWHNYIMKADEIRFVVGRLKFSNHKTGAPFPSAVVVFRSNQKGQR